MEINGKSLFILIYYTFQLRNDSSKIYCPIKIPRIVSNGKEMREIREIV